MRCISGAPRYRLRDPDEPPFLRTHPAGPRSPVCLQGRHRCLLVSIAGLAVVQIAATLATLLPALLFVCIAPSLFSRTEELPWKPASSPAVSV
jgi:hypothetical protein